MAILYVREISRQLINRYPLWYDGANESNRKWDVCMDNVPVRVSNSPAADEMREGRRALMHPNCLSRRNH